MIANKLALLAGLALAADETELLSGGAVSFLVVILAAAATFAIVRFSALRGTQAGLGALGWNFEHPASTLVLGLIGGVAAIAVTLGVVAAFGQFDLAGMEQALTSYTWPQRALHLSMGLLAAFGEETVFRGRLQTALRERIGLPGAIAVGAVIFSLYHLQFRPISLVAKTGLGLLFGALRGRDRSLYASGIAHAMHWVFFGFY